MKSSVKYHGGKSYLASWIISKMPKRKLFDLYREPFFGGGSVLFKLNGNGISEVVNDIDENLTRFWMVLQSKEMFTDFKRMLKTTPFSEVSWIIANEILTDHASKIESPVDLKDIWLAWAFFVKFRMSRQALGKDFATHTRRIRRGMNENVSAWWSAVDGLDEAMERLKRVEIRNMDFRKFIPKFDDARAIFYCDPPYLHSTRNTTSDYHHEMNIQDHTDLLDLLSELKGKFLLSGYKSILYSRIAKRYGWNRHEKSIDNKASSRKTKKQKIECLWTNF